MEPASSKPTDRRLVVYVACGLLASVAFVAFDLYSESRIGEGTMESPHAGAHFIIDHVLPLILGPLLGVSAHYGRLRSRLSAAEESAARAEALRTRLQKVERDQALWVLAATVLHEVNNPLHALRLLLDELSAERDEAARADLLRRAQLQADRLLSQVKTLRSMRGVAEPDLQELDLRHVLSAIADDAAALAAQQGFDVRLEGERPVMASIDPAYVRTIVENLLDNSLHALRLRGAGSITVELREEPRRAVVRVTDDGGELDGAARETLFEPLVSTKHNGLGLGLPIARALARSMGGELSLEPAAPKTFRLELPLVRAS